MRKGTWTVGCLVALAAMAAAQAQTVALKARYEPGTYVMTTKFDMDSTSTMSSGQSVNQKMKMMMVAEIEAGQRDADGTQTVRLTFKRAVQSVEGGGMAMAYDSADPSSGHPMLGAGLTPMLNRPTVVKMDANDKVASASGMDEVWEDLAADNPAMAKGMKEQFGNRYVSHMVNWAADMMPSGPVAAGSSWDADRKETVPMLGEVQVKQKCTLKEIKSTPGGKVAVIAFTSRIEKDKAEASDTGAPMAMTFSNIRIDQSGTVEVLLDSGLPLSYSADFKQSMELSSKPQEGAEEAPEQGGMNMTMQQNGKVQMSIQKGKYVPPATAPAMPAATGSPAS